MSASQVSALNYKDELPVSSGFESVDENNISAAKLLQDHVESYEEKINGLFLRYNSQNSEVIDVINQSLKQMSRSLDIIQYKSIDPKVVNEVMQSIVTDLKKINNKMKIYLEQERQIHVQSISFIQDNYVRIGQKISTILDNLVDSISQSLIQKESLSEKEKEIVRSLVIIRKQNNKLKDFKTLRFESELEMKQYLTDIIKAIREEILSIKS